MGLIIFRGSWGVYLAHGCYLPSRTFHLPLCILEPATYLTSIVFPFPLQVAYDTSSSSEGHETAPDAQMYCPHAKLADESPIADILDTVSTTPSSAWPGEVLCP